MKKATLTLLLSVLLISGCIHLSLYNPKAAIPTTATPDQVMGAVREALTHYGWTIDDEKPGMTTAHLQQKELFARVQVDYNRQQAEVRYLESKNMSYSKSGTKETIHSRYLVWARNIAERTQKNLNSNPQAAPATK